MKKSKFGLIGVLLVALLAVSCAPKTEAAPAAEAVVDAVLTVSGGADAAWSLDDLKALPQTSTDYTNKDGETTTYSGVSFAELLKAAGVEDYAAVTLLAADDYSVEIDQKTLNACTGCIVAIEEDGGLRSVMPDMQGALQVKDLVELQVK